MGESRFPRSRTQQLTAACALSAAGLLTAAGCTSQAQRTPAGLIPAQHTTASAPAASGVGSSPTAAAASAQASQTPVATTAGSTAGAPSSAAAAAAAPAACRNGDLRLREGYGTQSYPNQAWAIVLTNVGDRTCTVQGYPGLSIVDGETTINATRVLNGFRGDLPPLSRPPLVTLAPNAVAYAVVQWNLGDGPGCYPAGTGNIESTAPNTTDTVTLAEKVPMGTKAICSGLEINPVVPGTFGIAVG